MPAGSYQQDQHVWTEGGKQKLKAVTRLQAGRAEVRGWEKETGNERCRVCGVLWLKSKNCEFWASLTCCFSFYAKPRCPEEDGGSIKGLDQANMFWIYFEGN